MFSVLLVDDDAVFRTRIKSMINWDEHGFIIISEARNGRDAIKRIESCKPDIIITDINMPIINGIELIDYVSEFHKEIPVIALSAYNDFDYVRDSLKRGAFDYILKNQLNKESLLKTLKSASALSSNRLKESMKPIVNRERAIQEFLLLLLSGCMNNREEIRSSIKRLDLEVLEKGLAAAVMEPDNERLKNDLDEGEYYRFLYSVKSIIQESANLNGGATVAIIGRNRILVLIPMQEKSPHLFQDHCRRLLTVMQDNICRFMNESVSFGLSCPCMDLFELQQYYGRAVEVLESKRFQGETSFIAEVNSQRGHEQIITLDDSLEQELYASIHGKSDTTPDIIVREIFDEFIESGCSKEDILMVLAELLNIVIREIREKNISDEQIFEERLSYHTLSKFKNLPEQKEWFAVIYQRLDSYLKKSRQTSQYSENTKRAIKYIEKNYCLRVTLSDIAKAISVNSSYLSRLFKNDTGINIMDYLIKIRIEKSAWLMREGNLTLKNIADQVGIPNYNHFFKLFKKYYNVTPGEYKQCLKITKSE